MKTTVLERIKKIPDGILMVELFGLFGVIPALDTVKTLSDEGLVELNKYRNRVKAKEQIYQP